MFIEPSSYQTFFWLQGLPMEGEMTPWTWNYTAKQWLVATMV